MEKVLGHHRQSDFEFWPLTLLIFVIEATFLFLVQQTETSAIDNVAVYKNGK